MSTTLSPKRDSSVEEGRRLQDLVRLTSLVDPEALEAVTRPKGPPTRQQGRQPRPLLADLRTPQPGRLPTKLPPEDTWPP